MVAISAASCKAGTHNPDTGFSISILDPDALNLIYDGLTGIVSLLTTIVDLAGSVPSLTALLGGIATFKMPELGTSM